MSTKSSKKGVSSSRQSTPTINATTSEQVSSTDRPASPLTAQRVTRIQEKKELSNLNDRLATYIDRVRQLEADNIRLHSQVQSSQEITTREVVSIKSLYDKELIDARKLLDETSKERAKLQIVANKFEAEKDELAQRLNKKEKDFSIAIKKISNLEGNIDELKNRVSQANSDKKRAEDETKELQSEYDTLMNQMNVLKKQLEEETLLRVDLENRLQSLKEEISFKEQIHESELHESRVIQENEISDRVNDQLHQQYEQRLADELRELREENEAQMKFNREDLERKYEGQIADIEKALERKTVSEVNARVELNQLRTKNETLTSKINQIESVKDSLTHRIKDLERLIEQEREWKENALQDKESQLNQLREEVKALMNDYSDLLDIKIALDMEISAYRKLLEGEESRLNISSNGATNGGATSPSSTSASRVVSPRSFTPRGTKRRRVLLQEEENVTDIVVNSNAKGDVEISDHDQEGKYVKLYNKGEKEVSLSGWQLVRKAGNLETFFKFHRSIVIKPNASVTVWSSDSNAAHSPPSDIVMKGQTWFVAEAMSTTLVNNTGEEMAVRDTCKQLRKSLAQRSSEGYSFDAAQANVNERCCIM